MKQVFRFNKLPQTLTREMMERLDDVFNRVANDVLSVDRPRDEFDEDSFDKELADAGLRRAE